MRKYFKAVAVLLSLLSVLLLISCEKPAEPGKVNPKPDKKVNVEDQVVFETEMEKLKQKEIELDSIMVTIEKRHEQLIEKEYELDQKQIELIKKRTEVSSKEMTADTFMNIAYSMLLIGLILLLVSLIILSRLNKVLKAQKNEEEPQEEKEE